MSHGPESAFTKWLKKYRYINISLIYLGTALVVIHFAEAVVHGLHMPDITFSLIVVLALAGLPIVLLIAWAWSHKKKEDDEGSLIVKPVKRNWLKIAIATVLCIGLFATAVFIYNKFFYHSKFTGKVKSIAVLPFTNMNSDKEYESFSIGIASEITSRLSKIGSLDVRAFSSMIGFKNEKVKTLAQIATEVNVAALLSGQVQGENNKIRLHVELIDANTGNIIWVQTFNDDWGDIFEIQSELAEQVALKLNAEMTKDEKKRIERKPTDNAQAYEYVMQAGQLRDKFLQTLDTNFYLDGKALLEKAITLDSNYALAHAGLAHLYNTYTIYVQNDSAIKHEQVKEIDKALSFAPEDEFINAVKGSIFRTTLKNPEEAFRILKKAYEINPNNTNTLYELSLLESDVGLINERILLLKKAVKLDPLNSICFGYLGGAEVHLNNLEPGIQYLQTALKLSPDMFYLIDRLAYVYALKDSLKQTEYWLQKFLLTIPPERKSNFYKTYGQYPAYCYARLGNKAKALEISKHWRVLLALGMKEEALKDMIDKQNNRNIPFYINDYLIFKTHLSHKDFDVIRTDPRFLELMEKKRIQYEENKKRFNIAGILN